MLKKNILNRITGRRDKMDDYHKKLLDELPSLGLWHHKIELEKGIFTNGNPQGCYNPEERWKIFEPFVPKDLTGKSVLDLACNSGYFLMQMKKRGAERVVGVDNFKGNKEKVDFTSKWFDVDIEFVLEDAHVYCLTTEERFDYIICFGLFYHLKYGTLVLDRLAEMTKSRLFFHTITSDPGNVSKFTPENNYVGEDKYEKLNVDEFPRMMFIEKAFNNDWTDWWVPNDAAVYSLLRAAGLKIISRPSKQSLFVCEPEKSFGKKVYQKCVFPRYGKEGHDILP